MIERSPPYLNQSQLKAFNWIATKGAPKINNFEELSDVFKNYLAKCLDMDAEKRPNAQRLLKVSIFLFKNNC
jgi:p21-activated kinase 1